MDAETNIGKISWLGYGAEILTVFFALIVLAGRVYAQSYWNVYGLSAQQIDNNFINYAIMSPSVAIVSVIMTAGTFLMISYMSKHMAGTVVIGNSRALNIAGLITFVIGTFFLGLILKSDTASWTIGTPGLVYGFAYLFCFGGFYTAMVTGINAVKVDEKDKTKIVATFGWLKNIPFIFIQVFFLVIFAATALWGIMDVAQKFGANEAKEAYITSPVENIDLNSSKGFADIVMNLNPDGTSLIQVKILAQANGFYYVSPGGTLNPPELDVRAIPSSQIQSIQYNVGITPIGQ